MWLSIIIPIYNAEKYLARCCDSIIAAIQKAGQTTEILLVDNNSTDQSSRIATHYHQKYPKLIKLFHCTTPGASAARNFGVQHAKGRYIWFTDADDYISPDAIKHLAALAKATHPSPDLIMFGAQRIDRQGHQSSYLSAVEPTKPDWRSRFIRYGMGPWQVIIRRSWWQKYHFTFREGIIHEDMELMSSLILFTDHFAALNQPLYFYCDNPESVLHQKQFNPHIFDIFPALTGLYQRFEAKKALSTYYAELEWFFIWNLLIDSARDFRQFKEGRSGFKKSRALLRQYFPHWRKNRFLSQKSFLFRLRAHLNYWGI